MASPQPAAAAGDELDLTNAHLPSLESVDIHAGLTVRLGVSPGGRGSSQE